MLLAWAALQSYSHLASGVWRKKFRQTPSARCIRFSINTQSRYAGVLACQRAGRARTAPVAIAPGTDFIYHEPRIMCGIAGLISTDPETRIGAMLKSIEHRGRDDEGIW